MLPQRIQAWLDDPEDYEAGLLLLKETGPSSFLMGILARGADTFTRAKLQDALQKALDSIPAPASDPTPQGETKPVNTQAVTDLELAAFRLMDERGELKARIRARQDDDTAQELRRDWAFRILAIGTEIDDIYSRIAFFRQYGYFPPDKTAGVERDAQATLRNVTTYVSRYKGKLGKLKPNDPQYQPTLALLQRYQDEKRLLELQLSNAS
ncbi:hypothetical protein [Tellurirhabdus bombi]|uniref:hypothetical protein n=1 Tax=Tellurirhabdus bombi TaxID=2907205 RepID=UPI001F378D63|nr:hypothetical protein [Tellurirhabdus bombi]